MQVGNTISGYGSIRVFEFLSGDWIQLGQTIYGSSAQDLIGKTVEISGDGNTIVFSDDNFNNYHGYLMSMSIV